jgi:hypothetical protein
MHLLRAVAAKLEHDSGVKHRPKHVYFAVEDEFPEVIEHLEFSRKTYDLDVVRYDCGIVQVRRVRTQPSAFPHIFSHIIA